MALPRGKTGMTLKELRPGGFPAKAEGKGGGKEFPPMEATDFFNGAQAGTGRSLAPPRAAMPPPFAKAKAAMGGAPVAKPVMPSLGRRRAPKLTGKLRKPVIDLTGGY